MPYFKLLTGLSGGNIACDVRQPVRSKCRQIYLHNRSTVTARRNPGDDILKIPAPLLRTKASLEKTLEFHLPVNLRVLFLIHFFQLLHTACKRPDQFFLVDGF